jgi:cytochrome c1
MIRKLPKKAKRETRFRSQRHLSHVRGHACVVCDASAPIEAAHVRLGSGAGMGQKPHDYRALALCKDCHARQHTVGEATFWGNAWHNGLSVSPDDLIEEFIKSSPVRREIEAHRNA